MSRMGKRITAVTLTFALTLVSVCGGVRIHGVTPKVKEAQAAEAQGKYVSSIMISNASSKQNAEKELGDEYTVLDTDFGKSAGTHAWIGYTTSDDPEMAITDIKVMDMEGNFNYSDYQDLLNKQKDAVEDQMKVILPAVKEYAKNYDAGYLSAVTMYDMLNYFYEDDSQKGMGDYLLDAGRALAMNPDNITVEDDLEKVILQGNNDAISSIENILLQAQGSEQKKGSWMIRLSKLGPNGLEAEYKQAYPGYNKKQIKNQMKQDLDEKANLILENLTVVQESFKECEASELWQAVESSEEDAIENVIDETVNTEDVALIDESTTEEEATKLVIDSANDAAEAADAGETMVETVLIMYMKGISYGEDTSMYDFFMREDLKAEDLYPMAYLISRGQESLMEDVGVYGLFISVLSEGKAEDADPEDKAAMEELLSSPHSVYEGVDRGIFEGDTAITGPAMQRMVTEDTVFLINGKVYYNLGIFALTIISLVAFVRNLDIKVVDGYYRGPDFIDKNTMQGSAKFRVGLDKIKAEYKEYRSMLDAKLKTFDRNYLRSELRYLEENGFLKKGSINYAAVTQDYFSEQVHTLTPAQQRAVLAPDGWVAKQRQKHNRALNQMINKNEKLLAAKKAKLDIKESKWILRGDLERKVGFWTRNGARIIAVVAAVAAVAMAAFEIYDLTSGGKDVVTYSDIDMPLRMIDRTYPTGSKEITYANYIAGLKANGKKADLHNWKGDGWLNIYTTIDTDAGDPILAQDFGVRGTATDADPDMIPVVRFGDSDAYDVSGSKGYLFFRRNAPASTGTEQVVAADTDDSQTPVDDAKATEEEAEVGGTVFGSPGMLWIVLIMLAVVAFGAAGAGVYFRKRR